MLLAEYINWLFSELPTYYWGRLLSLRLTECCRQDTVDRNDMDTYFIMYRWSKTLLSAVEMLLDSLLYKFAIDIDIDIGIYVIIIITVINCKQSYLCVSQGSAATLFGRDEWVYNIIMRNFHRIQYWVHQNYRKWFVFRRVIQNIKGEPNRGTFFETAYVCVCYVRWKCYSWCSRRHSDGRILPASVPAYEER